MSTKIFSSNYSIGFKCCQSLLKVLVKLSLSGYKKYLLFGSVQTSITAHSNPNKVDSRESSSLFTGTQKIQPSKHSISLNVDSLWFHEVLTEVVNKKGLRQFLYLHIKNLNKHCSH